MKKFLGLLALILLMNFSVTNAAQVQSIIDTAGVLNASKVNALNQKIQRVEQAHKIRIAVAFVKSTGGRDIVAVANELLNENFSDGENGGIILFVDVGGRQYYISTNSLMRKKITNDKGIPALEDDIQSLLTSGNYASAGNEFVEGVDELMTYYETNDAPYGARSGGFDPMAAALAVIIALFLGTVIRSILIGSMSNVHHAFEAIDYLKKNTVDFKEKRDTFLFVNVTRRPKPRGGSRSNDNNNDYSSNEMIF